jgi:hypothetical protein
MPGFLRRLAGALALLALVVSACSQAGTSASDGTPSASAPSGAVVDLLDFTAPLVGGGTLRGSDYVGKDVAIWFWAPW